MANETMALWEVQSGAANGTEATATATHTQLFNPDSRNPSDGAYASDFDIAFRRAVPENEAVAADNNELQDMGIDGLDIVITGKSGNTDNDDATNMVNKFSKWLKDGNTTTGFLKGRFGLRNDNAPQWNVVPTSTYGYHIRDIQLRYVGENFDQVEFVIKLSLGGDITSAI